jgi:elongation factor P
MGIDVDAMVKGRTATASCKPAVPGNGARIMVPPHTATGPRVVVNTRESRCVERAQA